MTRIARTLAIAASALALAACASTRGLHPAGHEIPPDSLRTQRSLAGAPVSGYADGEPGERKHCGSNSTGCGDGRPPRLRPLLLLHASASLDSVAHL